MQVKVGKNTIENNLTDWLQTSPAALYLQEVASGGVLFIKNGYQNSKQFFESKLNLKSENQKALRLDLDIKRSTEK